MATLTDVAQDYKGAQRTEQVQRKRRDTQIRKAVKAGTSVSEVSRVTGLTRQAVYNILAREV